MKDKKWNLLSIILIIIYVLVLTPIVLQNDVFYTIKNGENLLKYGLDFLDHSSFLDLSYIYPHFLFDLLIMGLYKIGGFFALYIFKVVMYSVISIFYYFILRRITKTKFFSLLFTILFISLFSPLIAARPQVITYLLFMIEYCLLEKYVRSGKNKYLYPLPFISLIIANFHGAVLPFFFILMLPYLASDILHHRLGFSNKKLVANNKLNLKYFLGIMVISFLTSLINPSGIESILYTFKTMEGETMSYISEHKPSTFRNCPQLFIFAFIFFVINFFVAPKFRTSSLLLILGLMFMNLTSIRHLSFVLLLAIPSYIEVVINSVSLKRIEKYDHFFCLLFKKCLPILIIYMGVRLYMVVPNINLDKMIPKDIYPVEACSYIQKNMDYKNIRLFNSYGDGSYILYREIPVFMDSRADLYTKPFNKKYDVFNDYFEISEKGNMELMEKYHFTHALLSKKDRLIKVFDEKYKLLWQDENFTIYQIENE